MPLPIAIAGAIVFCIVLIIAACVFIDHGNFVNLDGGD